MKKEYLQHREIMGKSSARKEVLAVKGVGNETADSILLFAYKQKQFKVDAYTKRIFSYLGYFDEKEKYMNIKKLFEWKIWSIATYGFGNCI